MECGRCREVVSAGLDGEATPGEEAAAEAHLADCAPCRRTSDRFATLTRRARITLAEEGPDLVDSVLTRVLGPDPATASVPPLTVLPTPPVTCGCARTCACGCQDGHTCRCHAGAA